MQYLRGPGDIITLLTTLVTLIFKCHAATPSAVSVPAASDFLGFDGAWSPVSVRVGTPPQKEDLFVSTASQETWVIGPGYCNGAKSCIDERGGVFSIDNSTTWNSQGTYNLGLDPYLGFNNSDIGIYGLDNISLSDTIDVSQQLVAVVNASTDYWLGLFGLGVKGGTNLSTANPKSFLSTMVEDKSLIPSHSYGYTAGAYNRLKGIPASLTLGGYDANRFVSHKTSFGLVGPDQKPVVAIKRITAIAKPTALSNVSTVWRDNTIELLAASEADNFTIDSTTPFLWLPESVCLEFEKALGLSYDEDLELYTFEKNATQHDTLVKWDLSFDFEIAAAFGSNSTVTLPISYSAFDLQLSFPYPNAATTKLKPNGPKINYFPLRKASNNSQYTIGRSFLQETYLVVDYERNNFSVYPATYSVDASTNTNLVDITRPVDGLWAGPDVAGGSALSNGSIAGITIAAVFGLGFFVCLLVIFRKIRREHPGNGYTKEKDDASMNSRSTEGFVRWLFCLPTPHVQSEKDAFEAPNDREVLEIGGSEVEGSDTQIRGYYERDARENKEANTVINAIGHDPSMPVELPYRSSNYRLSTREIPNSGNFPANLNFSRPGKPAFKPANQPPQRHDTQKSTFISSPSESENSKDNSGPLHVVSPISPHLPRRHDTHRSTFESSDSGDGKADSDPSHIVSPMSPEHDDESSQSSTLDNIARRAAWFISNSTPSGSSERSSGTERTPFGTISIEERAGFGATPSRQNTIASQQDTVSSMDPAYTIGSISSVSPQLSRDSHRQRSSASHAHLSPNSNTRAPRNSRATAIENRDSASSSSGSRSATSTVTNVIRQSVQRGFSWLSSPTPQEQQQRRRQSEGSNLGPSRTPVTAPSVNTEQSPYSPARWIEFWKTGRDPRLGPASDRNS